MFEFVDFIIMEEACPYPFVNVMFVCLGLMQARFVYECAIWIEDGKKCLAIKTQTHTLCFKWFNTNAIYKYCLNASIVTTKAATIIDRYN